MRSQQQQDVETGTPNDTALPGMQRTASIKTKFGMSVRCESLGLYWFSSNGT